jgi:hypothetical protein
MLHDDAAEESFTVQNNTTAAREAITAAVASPYGARLVLLSPFHLSFIDMKRLGQASFESKSVWVIFLFSLISIIKYENLSMLRKILV